MKEQKQADKRMKEVARIPGHFTRGSRVFQNTGSFKCVDWVHFVTTGILHVLKPCLQGDAEKALVALVTALRLLLSATSDVDPLADPLQDFKRRGLVCQALKLQIIDNLVIYERGVSEAELPPVLHTLLHVPDAIYRWNGVHNQWCFTNERLPPCCCHLFAITLLSYFPVDYVGFLVG